MKLIIICVAVFVIGTMATPVPNAQTTDSEAEKIEVDEVGEVKPKENIAPPEYFGSVVGEIVVGSSFVNVQRSGPKEKNEKRGPSVSRFIAGPEITLSSGTDASPGTEGKRAPLQINGATLVFNNEAHITEIV